tara:strand:+ start:8222 stop:8746 length:525 start_codon:yes stop_codon:yes gene_type:complete
MPTFVNAAMVTGVVKDTDKATSGGNQFVSQENKVVQVESDGRVHHSYITRSGTFEATVTAGTSGTMVLNEKTLSYERVGGIVFVTGNLTITSLSSPVGSINITNLPFISSADSVANVNIQAPSSGDISFTGWLLNDSTTLTIYENSGAQPSAAAELLQASSTIYISLTYLTDAA